MPASPCDKPSRGMNPLPQRAHRGRDTTAWPRPGMAGSVDAGSHSGSRGCVVRCPFACALMWRGSGSLFLLCLTHSQQLFVYQFNI